MSRFGGKKLKRLSSILVRVPAWLRMHLFQKTDRWTSYRPRGQKDRKTASDLVISDPDLFLQDHKFIAGFDHSLNLGLVSISNAMPKGSQVKCWQSVLGWPHSGMEDSLVGETCAESQGATREHIEKGSTNCVTLEHLRFVSSFKDFSKTTKTIQTTDSLGTYLEILHSLSFCAM